MLNLVSPFVSSSFLNQEGINNYFSILSHYSSACNFIFHWFDKVFL